MQKTIALFLKRYNALANFIAKHSLRVGCRVEPMKESCPNMFFWGKPHSFEKLKLSAKAHSFEKLKLLSSQPMLIRIAAVKNIETSFIFGVVPNFGCTRCELK